MSTTTCVDGAGVPSSRRGSAAPGPLEAAATLPGSRRLRELDVLRGAAVVGMILVNNQGSGAHAFWSLSHADWNGFTFADLVFPLFIFVLGAAMAAVHARGRPAPARVARRAALLFAIGFGLNALPPTHLTDVTVMGVLQRLGLVYLLASLVVLYLPARRQVALAIAVLVGYGLLLSLGPIRPDWSVPGLIDRFLLGASHVYKNGFYDPEGLASTPAAVVTALAGYWAVSFLQRWSSTSPSPLRQPSTTTVRSTFVPATSAERTLVSWGTALVLAGAAASVLIPVNKRLWTPSYVVLTAGCSLLALAAVRWFVTTGRAPRAVHAAEVFGRNALVVFVGSELLVSVLRDRTGARVWLYSHVYEHLGFRLGSLAYSVVIAALWWAVAETLWRRRIVVKL